MIKHVINIRGKNLYVEVLGEEGLPAILHIHGGPGGVGSTDFVQYQGKRLSEHFKIVAVDQRGVWRSEAIYVDEEITFEDLIYDYEELRNVLGITSWSVIAHSFGGYVASLYVDMFPESIDCMIFEGPSFTFALSERSLIRAVADQLRINGKEELFEYYVKSISKESDYKKINAIMGKAFNDLGDDGPVFWYGDDKQVINRIVGANPETLDLWKKSNHTRSKLMKDWRMYHSILDSISMVDKPTLLIKGMHDPITCEEQINEFKVKFINHCFEMFYESGHYVRVEEPDKYAEVVTQFIFNRRKALVRYNE
ncbi:alpha/beta hydrolase [Paenibacillus qinlingensis]|uniref:Proline iminopeptidase n=1 Tax=Paenibacillus qinlingensis TaxID=1837343 RepID=A0ABU1P5Q8_9BACL|nr:alpha/beta hydrolase [Paenibacillus qinlingensis]MDR6555093.1 proline iminopeptidase [Paenibacillus qinlingensis]